LPVTSVERDAGFLKTAFDSDESLSEIRFSPWSVRFLLSREALMQNQMTVTMIAATLRRQVQDWASVFNSDDNDCDTADKVGGIIRICLHAQPLERDLDWQKPTGETLLDPTALENVTSDEWKYACCEQYAQQALMHCLTVSVNGIPGVIGSVPRKANVIRYCQETGAVLKNQHEWMIKTQGTNLREVLTMQGVDWTRTICNHAIEVQKVLGIEAARAVLLDEIRKVFSCSDAYVDYRYISLLVDKMTADGQVTPVSRHAFRKMLTGPYTRAAFEQQTDVLCDAAMMAEYEDGNDMRAAIMMGKHIPQGTGTMFDTICSLDALTSQPSKTMQSIHEQRILETPPIVPVPATLRNPFGFTGQRIEKPVEIQAQKTPIVPILPSNPFFRENPMLGNIVSEKRAAPFVPRQSGKRYRMHSPSLFLE